MVWYLRVEPNSGAPDAGQFAYGFAGWQPVVGDWNGDGSDSVGVFAPQTATWYLRNENGSGAPDYAPFAYGFATWKPVAGAWTGPAGSGPGSAGISPTPERSVEALDDLFSTLS
jgi:hypothetical protein